MNCRGSRFDGWLGTVGPETPPTRYRLVFVDRLCSRGGQFPVGFRMPKDRTAKSNRSRVVDVVDVAKAFLWYLTPFGRLHPRETLVSVAKLQGFETTIKYPRHQANSVRGPAHIKQPKAIGQSLPATSRPIHLPLLPYASTMARNLQYPTNRRSSASLLQWRSEERRVGKECRSRWS